MGHASAPKGKKKKKPVHHSSEIIGANKERGCALECPKHIKK